MFFRYKRKEVSGFFGLNASRFFVTDAIFDTLWQKFNKLFLKQHKIYLLALINYYEKEIISGIIWASTSTKETIIGEA